MTGKPSKEFYGSFVVLFMGLLWRSIFPKIIQLAIVTNTRHKPSMEWAYAFERTFFSRRHSTVSSVLCEGSNSKIGFSVIQRVAIDVIRSVLALVRKFQNKSSHGVLTRLFSIQANATNRIESSCIVLGCVPPMSHYAPIIFYINNSPQSLRQWYKSVFLFLGCHGRSSTAARIRPGQQPLTLLLYQGGVI